VQIVTHGDPKLTKKTESGGRAWDLRVQLLLGNGTVIGENKNTPCSIWVIGVISKRILEPCLMTRKYMMRWASRSREANKPKEKHLKGSTDQDQKTTLEATPKTAGAGSE